MVRKWLVGAIITATLAFASTASAQYTGPGGTSGAAPTYTKKSYGVNKAAMAALIGGGAAGGLFLLRHHRHHTLTACVGPDGRSLDDGKDIYTVVGTTLTPGEHIVAAGKKVKSEGNAPGFEVTSVRRDLGRCEQQPTMSAQQ